MRLAPRALVAALLSAGLLAGLASGAQAKGLTTWNVTVTNLTSGQPMSPPIWAVHKNSLDVWSVGQPASFEVQRVAEDAQNQFLLAALDADARVLDTRVETGSPAGPILPGSSREFAIRTDNAYNRLTILWMLVRSNDGFTGLDSLRLHTTDKSISLNAYQAGTERNNEMCAFIPGPPCNMPGVRDPEDGVIGPHPGILIPGSDVFGFAWTNPVATIEIERVG